MNYFSIFLSKIGIEKKLNFFFKDFNFLDLIKYLK
jgi:hypothetical protein